MQLQAHDNAGHHYPLKKLASSEAIRVKPSNLERTDEHPQEGKIVNGRCMRYGEWFNLQDLLDTSMNRDSTAGAALGTPSPPSMAGSNFSWCLLLQVRAVGAPLEPGLPPGCPRREWLGSGRGNYPDTCDGCGLT